MKKLRLDKLLVSRGLFENEGDALRSVMAHEVKVDGEYAQSAAMLVKPDAIIEVKGSKQFVSRGGLKLQSALEAFEQAVVGLNCIDVGCSTGGFTDCLLQAGAASVTAVDVGYGDFAWKLRQDPRVRLFERTNIRIADPVALGAPFDLIVADLSFIGLASLAPVFARLAAPGSVFIGLVKPQFESRVGETNERGLVTDESIRLRTVEEVRSALEQVGFKCESVIESPIEGKRSKNVEYLVHAIKSA